MHLMPGALPLQKSMAGLGEGDRTTGSLSWVASLQAYLRSTTHAHADPQVTAQRKVLGDIVLENPTSADAWHRFLQHEESVAAVNRAVPDQAGKGISLYHLYHKATEMVQRNKGRASEAYINIWLGYARHQW